MCQKRVATMMNFVKRFRAMMNPPEHQLLEYHPNLKQLDGWLEQILANFEDDPFPNLISFLAATAHWYDHDLTSIINVFKNVNAGQYDAVIENLQQLEHHIARAGRSEFGMNRTKPGERVTADVVFLGNIYGLFTHPVSRWQTGKNEAKDSWMGLVDVNPYDVISDQARSVIRRCAPPLHEQVKALVGVCEAYTQKTSGSQVASSSGGFGPRNDPGDSEFNTAAAVGLGYIAFGGGD